MQRLEVEAELIPPGLPPELEPVAHLLDETGYVSGEECALLEYQRRWIYDRSPVKVAAKSRQVGITWATAYEAVEVASLRRSDGGMDVYFMSMSQDDARQFIDTCADWIEWLSPIITELLDASDVESGTEWFEDDDGNEIMAYQIRFPSGFKIYALPSRPARLRGKQGYAICDEAAQQDIEAWQAAAGGLLIWGGRLAFISTYFGTDNGFYQLVDEIKSGEKKWSLHEIDIYSALRDGLYRRICRARLRREWTPELEAEWVEWLRDFYGEGFAQECECIASGSGGAYIPRELAQRNAVLGYDACSVVEIKGEGEDRARLWVNGELVGQSDLTWGNESVHATPEQRRATLRRWLDDHLSPIIAKIKADGMPVYAGLDYGREGNLSTFTFCDLMRNSTRRMRLVVELERVPYSQQDQIQDYIWERLTNLEAGAADGGGLGANSAERCRDRTGGKIKVEKIVGGWRERTFPAVRKKLQNGTLQLPARFEPMLSDLASLRMKNGKIILPNVVSKDGRAQKRHADSAVALALMEQSIQTDPDHGRRKPQRRRRKLPRISL